MLRFLVILLSLLFSGFTYAATEKYLCKAFDEDSQSEYEWNVTITSVENDIFDLRGDALDDAWHYTGHGFKKENQYYFYWKMSDSGEPGLVHYTIKYNRILKGDWIAENSQKVLSETCTKI